MLNDSPSLRPYLQEIFAREYRNGRKLFLDASEFEATRIPETPTFTLEQAINENWLPKLSVG